VTARWQLWAPRAGRVELVIAVDGRDERRAAEPAGDGVWTCAPPPVGADYAISVDDGPLRPDPRSPWQPHGVHGRSRWRDDAPVDDGFCARPLASALIYELHVGTFSAAGTFDGVAERLDHLVALGVSHVELMPVAAFPGRHGWGYDGVALFAPHEPYGGPAGLRRLVAACHRRGLAVILDVVHNHLGPDGNYLGELGPYFTDHYRTPWGAAINLDGAGSDHVRRFLCDSACHWLRDHGIDGLRLDAVHALHDRSARPFLEQLADEVAALEAGLGRPLVLIAESDLNDPRLVRGRDAGGFGLHAQWSDDFHHAIHAALTGERAGYYADFGALGDIAAALTGGYVYDGRASRYRGQRHGRPLGELGGERLLGYAQTHDQVGNRARGERLGHLVSPGLLRAAAALVFVAPFVPMLFQGEEWAAASPFLYFTDHESPELAEAVRRGRRREFAAHGWDPDRIPDPQDPDTFRRSRLDWSEREREPHRGVLAWYTALAALRRAEPALRDGRRDLVEVAVDELERWIRVGRGGVTLVANLAPAPRRLPRPPGAPRLHFPDGPDIAGDVMTMPAEGVCIWVAA